MSSLSPFFDYLPDNIQAEYPEWENWLASPFPEYLPSDVEERLPAFEKLILIRSLKPKIFYRALETYMIERIGHQFNQV